MLLHCRVLHDRVAQHRWLIAGVFFCFFVKPDNIARPRRHVEGADIGIEVFGATYLDSMAIWIFGLSPFWLKQFGFVPLDPSNSCLTFCRGVVPS